MTVFDHFLTTFGVKSDCNASLLLRYKNALFTSERGVFVHAPERVLRATTLFFSHLGPPVPSVTPF